MKKLLIALILFTSCSPKVYEPMSKKAIEKRKQGQKVRKTTLVIIVIVYVSMLPLLGEDFTTK